MTDEAETRLPLREAHRRAVRTRLIEAALTLFTQNGYSATTVEDIADAANVSPRTFFRYFGTKDAVVLGKFDDTGDHLALALLERPAGEVPWVALRRMFDYFVDYTGNPVRMQQSRVVDAIIADSDDLRAGYLERMERMQTLAAEALQERTSLSPFEARTLVAAAFSCLNVAGRSGSELGPALDIAMDSLGANT